MAKVHELVSNTFQTLSRLDRPSRERKVRKEEAGVLGFTCSSYRRTGILLACIQASQRGPTLRGTFNKIRGPPRNVAEFTCMEVNSKRAVGMLVRVETYTIVESNSEFFIPPAVTVVCVVGHHRNPALNFAICNLHLYIASHASP